VVGAPSWVGPRCTVDDDDDDDDDFIYPNPSTPRGVLYL
jgi:hypothetical protein